MVEEKVNIFKRAELFLGEVKEELGKVNWSTRAQLIQSTKVVIMSTFVMALYLFGVDTFFSWVLQKFLAMRF